jgi:DNA-binding NarL/FixJ family response regulator
MTTNNIHVLASGGPAAQLVLADRSLADSAIAVRAIRRLFPHLEVRPVTNLAEAERALACTRCATTLVASALDGKTCERTIRWFARQRRGIVVAMLENCHDRHRQEALAAGASYVCSKPELLIAQLRHELAARLEGGAQELSWMMG